MNGVFEVGGSVIWLQQAGRQAEKVGVLLWRVARRQWCIFMTVFKHASSGFTAVTDPDRYLSCGNVRDHRKPWSGSRLAPTPPRQRQPVALTWGGERTERMNHGVPKKEQEPTGAEPRVRHPESRRHGVVFGHDHPARPDVRGTVDANGQVLGAALLAKLLAAKLTWQQQRSRDRAVVRVACRVGLSPSPFPFSCVWPGRERLGLPHHL